MSKYRRDNKEFRVSVARRVSTRPQPKESVTARVVYWIIANAIKVWAIAGKIVGER